MSDDVAAFYAQFQPTEGPFIIVPSFGKLGFQSDFILTSKLFNISFLFKPCGNPATGRVPQCRCEWKMD